MKDNKVDNKILSKDIFVISTYLNLLNNKDKNNFKNYSIIFNWFLKKKKII